MNLYSLLVYIKHTGDEPPKDSNHTHIYIKSIYAAHHINPLYRAFVENPKATQLVKTIPVFIEFVGSPQHSH